MTTPRLTRTQVYAGARNPEQLKITIEQGPSGLDLSVATGATMLVTGSQSPWACVIASQSATEIVIVHQFAAGDVDIPGAILTIHPQLTAPGWPNPVRCTPFELQVLTY